MKIKYKSRKLEKECTDYPSTLSAYGEDNASKIHQRIYEISAANSVEEMIKFNIGRCHPLKGKRNKEYGVDLVHPHRLCFKKDKDETGTVIIISIVDYH